MELPESIKKHIGQEDGEKDRIGMSDSSILLFHDKILKIQDDNDEAQNEWHMLQWLQNRLPVSEVFAYEVRDGKSWLLMERCDGKWLVTVIIWNIHQNRFTFWHRVL